MKIQIFSDLHIDISLTKPIIIMDGVEAVVVAGDTCEGALKGFEALRRIVPNVIPIIAVMGNHEYYRRFVDKELDQARTDAAKFNIHLLEDDTVELNGVRFVGATLWTDYALFGNVTIPGAMEAARYGLNDHRLIGWRKKPWMRFRPHEAQLLHIASRRFLHETLAASVTEPTVVVTHHGIHWNSTLRLSRDDILSAAYVSDLANMIEAHQPALWVHGHVHASFDYQVGKTRVLCNPHGYWDENPGFNGRLVVELPS
jgi:Icc-related predicted phosphoesterase